MTEPRGPAEATSVAPGLVINGKFRVLSERASFEGEPSFRALHLGTGRRVELRVLPSGVAPRGPEAARMLRAARAAGRASHPNVLNVVDSGLDAEQRPFVVYEQFAGVPCSTLLAQNGACDARLASDIIGQVLDGLSALHARGVVHRRLSADCVLVEGSADDVRVKLIGLGYSSQPGKDDDLPELPRTFSRYLAPEARRGEQSATALDIYAAGVLLRCLLTGDASATHALPSEIENAIARATAEDPDERFQTAAQFRACLGAIIGPTVRESLLPSGSLQADLRFLGKRRDADGGGKKGALAPVGGKLELFAVLLIVESLYARLGAAGWNALRARVPEIEQLLPAAGRGAEYRIDGVPLPLVGEMLAAADAASARGALRFIAELGEELARRGLDRFCGALPAELTPELLVACIPVLWRSIVRSGEVVQLEQRDGYARLSVRTPGGGTLELSALFASLLRSQLRVLSPQAEVNVSAAQALGDGADVLIVSW